MHTFVTTEAAQRKNNSFALVELPTWPHISAAFEDSAYSLLVYNHQPPDADEVGSLKLDALLDAEVSWEWFARHDLDGQRLVEEIQAYNDEIEGRARWLEDQAARLRSKKRPAIAGVSR